MTKRALSKTRAHIVNLSKCVAVILEGQLLKAGAYVV
jgi:hypothetical protein